MKRRHQPIPTSQIVKRALAQFRGRGKDVRLGALLTRAWPNIVGELMGRFCFPVGIVGHELTVGVTSSVWLAEAKYQEDLFLENIAKHLGPKAIQRVRFTMLAKPPEGLVKPAKSILEVQEDRELSDSQKAKLEKDLEKIPDPALREQLRRVLTKALARPE